jgi:hypothetical protein
VAAVNGEHEGGVRGNFLPDSSSQPSPRRTEEKGPEYRRSEEKGPEFGPRRRGQILGKLATIDHEKPHLY